MRINVELYVAGQTFTETVNATDYQQAKQVALARNPGATVVSINRDFHDDNKSIEFNSSSNANEKRSTGGGSDMDLQSFLGLCIVGGVIWAFVAYTPILFLGGGIAIGGVIGKLMPKHKLLSGAILAIILGSFGYGIGEKLQDNWTYNTNEIEKSYDI